VAQPPELDDLAKLMQQVPADRPNGKPTPFSVRRFAGPQMHVEQLDHLRIAHLTDLHVGRVTPMPVQYRAIDLANAAKPDLVVMTGDFVAHSQLYLDALTDVVQRLEAPVICTLGNHDHWAGADEVRWALRRGGAEVLDNAHTTITLRHQPLQVLGLDDAYTGHADRDKARKGLRKDRPVLGLSHIAEEADALWYYGVPLVLSGHTHAGQITLARLHELWLGRLAGHRYVHGLYGAREGEGAVYVGAGIGASVWPLRIGDRGRREVTLFELGQPVGKYDEDHAEQEALPGREPSERKRLKRVAQVHKKRLKRERKKANGGRSIFDFGRRRDDS